MMRYALYFVLAAAVLSGCATRREVGRLESRVALLESRLSSAEDRMNKQLEKNAAKSDDGDQAIRRDLASVGAKMDSLGRRVSILEGRTEEVQTSAGKVNINAARLTEIQDEQLRQQEKITALEARLNEMSTAVTGDSQRGGEDFDDEAVYKEAYEAHRAEKYEDARKGFESILSKKPKSKFVPNAEFWLGQGYYEQKRYGEALRHFSNVVKEHSDSNKYCSALLRLGVTLDDMKETAKSKFFFSEVVNKCPDTPEAKNADRRLKRE